MYRNEYQLRQEIIWVTRIVTEQGLVRSSDGNISVRIDDNRFLMTPRGLYKMAMETEDPIVVDWEGNVLKGKGGYLPTTEMRMHLEIYRQRPDVNAVLHAHPPHCVALTIASLGFPTEMMPEIMSTIGDVPTVRYAPPGSEELVLQMRASIKEHDALLLSHHGSITVGKTVEEALIILERLEHMARIYSIALRLGEPRPLPEEEIVRLRAIARKNRGQRIENLQ